MTLSQLTTIELEASCHEVFPWLVQPERVQQWLPALTAWSFDPSFTDVPVQGTTFTVEGTIGTITSTIQGEILEIESPHLLVAHGSNEYFAGRLHIQLQSLATNRCQLKVEVVEEQVSLVLQLFKKQIGQTMLQMPLQKLKQCVEETGETE
jgi:uncharacterized protein YndB with AHSA1/START domain